MAARYWQDLTTVDFARFDAESTVALLPVAAIEQHGPHLPLATDAIINAGIVDATVKQLRAEPSVLVLPALSIGSSLEHSAYAGTLSIDAETLLATLKQVGASVACSGIRKLVILNTHGGQNALVDVVAVRLRAAHAMLVARANYHRFGAPPGLFSADDLLDDIHGGLVETSLMLHLRPELIRDSAIRDFSGLPRQLAERHRYLGAERPIGIGWMSQDLHASGACGDASRADAQRGKAYLEFVARALVELIIEISETPLSLMARDPATR